ncbi:MAG: signal peptidase II [Spirochaeta sp.]|jgi:signal peptidase II|nr:signal peptidase II [Spirochaeta sp.]
MAVYLSTDDAEDGHDPDEHTPGMMRSYGTSLGAPEPKELLTPLILTAVIVLLDQLTKWIIVANVPLYYESGLTIEVIGDFFRIIHARNLGIAFSIGDGLPFWVRKVLFVALPLGVILILFFGFYAHRDTTRGQRWMVAAILGGGVGNIIDRIFRPLGVVDFLDVKFYGLLGMERWPTFNVADASVVVGGILLIIAMLFTPQERT